MQPTSANQIEASDTQKKAYVSPRLINHGKVEQLTYTVGDPNASHPC